MKNLHKGFYLILSLLLIFQHEAFSQNKKFVKQTYKKLKSVKHKKLDITKPLQKIAFGSCSHQSRRQLIFKDVFNAKPDLWIWLGDNVYSDTYDMDKKKAHYEKQNGRSDYTKVRENIPIIGTWDDHDFGLNDSGKEFTQKKISQQLHFDFLGIDENSPLRKQEGVYCSYTIGSEGKLVKIILLDTRYHRDPEDSNGTILGEKQWLWLENQLKKNKAQLTLLISSIQILHISHRWEKWSNFPKEKKK